MTNASGASSSPTRHRVRVTQAPRLAAALIALVSASGWVGCGEGDPGEAERSSAALRSPVEPSVMKADHAVAISLEKAGPDDRPDVELKGDQGIHIVDSFDDTLPGQLSFDTGGGEATVTLLPGGQTYRSAGGRVSFPVSAAGTCAQLDFESPEVVGRWTVAARRRGAPASCESALNAVSTFSAEPGGGDSELRWKTCLWICKIGQGCYKRCTIHYRAPGVP